MFDITSLTESAGKAAGADPQLASDDELFDTVLGLEQIRRRVDAAEAHALAELEARGSTDIEFGLRTATWLAREAKLPRNCASTRVTVANQLRVHLDETDEQLADGRVSAAHARVMATAASNPRVGHQIVEMQSDLLAEAQLLAFEPWARQVAMITELLDQDGGHDPDHDLASNKLHFEDGFDRATRVLGTLTGDHAEIVRQGIETRADVLFRRCVEDHKVCPEIEVPHRDTLRAMALVELIREAQGVDLSSTRAPKTDVTLVLNAGAPETASTPDGVRLADGTTRLLCCDAAFTPIVIDNLGIPLDMGREQRLATEHQRRAAALRDGGCTFPGCYAPHTWVDMHHIVLWIKGGLTNLEDLLSLCRRHHGVVHRKGWTVHADDEGRFWIQTPSYRRFWCQRNGRIPDGPPPPPVIPTLSA